jgi:hypothetical protein
MNDISKMYIEDRYDRLSANFKAGNICDDSYNRGCRLLAIISEHEQQLPSEPGVVNKFLYLMFDGVFLD